jgi:hypothetical protein
MRMKQISLVMFGAAAVLTCVTTAAAAQSQGTSNADLVAQYATDKLKSDLTLTADQIPKVQKVNLAGAKELEALLNKYDADTSIAADRALARGLLDARRKQQLELKKIFTPAQWTLHQQHKAEQLALSQTEIMAQDLRLSRDQILSVARINQDGANKLVRAIEKPMSETKPVPGALLAAAKPVIDARDLQLEKVLTVDQFKKMQANRRALMELFVNEAGSTPNPSAAAAAPKPKP